jgi:hypothetical protein
MSSHQPELPIVMWGLPGYDSMERQEMSTIQSTILAKGTTVLVEVHGLPGDKVDSFPYLATYDVTPGEQVQVPAPDWSIRVTGRDTLPGYVLGVSEVAPDGPLRQILPRTTPSDSEAIQTLLAAWTSDRDSYRNRAFQLTKQARHFEGLAEDLTYHIDQVRQAAGIAE